MLCWPEAAIVAGGVIDAILLMIPRQTRVFQWLRYC
jgi:hypothetical protein